MLYKEYTQAGIGNNRIFGVLLCMRYLLKQDAHWNLFVDNILLKIRKTRDIIILSNAEGWYIYGDFRISG